MKTMFLAAAAALSLGIGAAYAGDGDGPQPTPCSPSFPGVIAQAPVQNAPAVATAQNGQAVHTYATQSSRGTWLFPPHTVAGRQQLTGAPRLRSGEAGTMPAFRVSGSTSSLLNSALDTPGAAFCPGLFRRAGTPVGGPCEAAWRQHRPFIECSWNVPIIPQPRLPPGSDIHGHAGTGPPAQRRQWRRTLPARSPRACSRNCPPPRRQARPTARPTGTRTGKPRANCSHRLQPARRRRGPACRHRDRRRAVRHGQFRPRRPARHRR